MWWMGWSSRLLNAGCSISGGWYRLNLPWLSVVEVFSKQTPSESRKGKIGASTNESRKEAAMYLYYVHHYSYDGIFNRAHIRPNRCPGTAKAHRVRKEDEYDGHRQGSPGI